jgi:hypothetical protein
VEWNFTASIVNWGFAAPINPRPVRVVLIKSTDSIGDATFTATTTRTRSHELVWSSNSSIARWLDWQPHTPGDPTFTPIEHSFGGSFATDTAVLRKACHCSSDDGSRQKAAVGARNGNTAERASAPPCMLELGLFLPDQRMESLLAAGSEDAAAAFSVRLANADVGWTVVPSVGAVNMLGNITIMC